MASRRLGNLGYVLAHSKVKADREDAPFLRHLISAMRDGSLDSAAEIAAPELKEYKLPGPNYIRMRLREPLREWLPTQMQYEAAFSRFEYLSAMAASDMYQKYYDNGFGAMLGLYLGYETLPAQLDKEIEKHGERWPMLRAGLFDSSLDRLKKVKAGFDESFRREHTRYMYGY